MSEELLNGRASQPLYPSCVAQPLHPPLARNPWGWSSGLSACIFSEKQFLGMKWALVMCRSGRNKLCAGRMMAISTLNVGPDQPEPKPNPNLSPNPNSNPNPNPNPKPNLGGSRSAGAATRLRRVFRWRKTKKAQGGRKASLETRPASCTKLYAYQSCT